jgi:hypothetical protein
MSSPSEAPEQLRVTGTVLRTFLRQGWSLGEHRSAGWLYLIAHRRGQSVVYKLIGPRFDNAGTHYLGHRIA